LLDSQAGATISYGPPGFDHDTAGNVGGQHYRKPMHPGRNRNAMLPTASNVMHAMDRAHGTKQHMQA
jgi:hypothetical protein